MADDMTLREEKRRETRLRIQDVAFRLVGERGFAGTTVECIAAAARVSPSTVYRYFGTKEGVFLWDELELPAVAMLRRELERRPALEAALTALDAVAAMGFHVPEDEMRRRARYLYDEPALRSAFAEAFTRFEHELTELFTEAGAGGVLEARILAGVTMTVVTAAIEAWTHAEPPVSLRQAVDAAEAALAEVVDR